MEDLLFIIVVGAMLIAFFIFLIIYGISITKEQKLKKKAEENEKIDDEPIQYETIEITVKVVDQCCRARMVGVKYPKSIEEYFISFEKDNGEVLNLAVPKECYDGFDIGQIGKLTLVDGELYSFVPD